MKINKKILIPVFATAMGLSLIGGVSGAVAWYQYNTKVEASWVGASVADGGSLLIRNDSATSPSWERSIVFAQSTDSLKLHPITFGAMTADGALPGAAYKHPEYGVEAMTGWTAAVKGTDYFEYKFTLKAQKIVDNEYVDTAATVNIESFILESATAGKTDVANAVRVHFASSVGNKLYSLDGGSINTNGQLDLNGDGHPDYHGGYAWDTDFEDVYTYGSGTQSSNKLTAGGSFINIPAEGLQFTLTIWLEGWQQIDSSAMWEPETTGDAEIHFGVTFSVPRTTFIAD